MYLPEWSVVWLAGLALCAVLASARRTRVLAIWLALILVVPVMLGAVFGVLTAFGMPLIYRDPGTGGDSYGFVVAFGTVGAVLLGALIGLVAAIVLARRITRKAPIF